MSLVARIRSRIPSFQVYRGYDIDALEENLCRFPIPKEEVKRAIFFANRANQCGKKLLRALFYGATAFAFQALGTIGVIWSLLSRHRITHVDIVWLVGALFFLFFCACRIVFALDATCRSRSDASEALRRFIDLADEDGDWSKI